MFMVIYNFCAPRITNVNYKASDFSILRNRLCDNLKDEVLSDSRKLDFLPNFVTGEVYKVIERMAGCSNEAIMEILHTEIQPLCLLFV